MKNFFLLLVFVSATFVFSSSGCKTCTAPTISLDPSNTDIVKSPGEIFSININVNGDKEDIRSVTVSKTMNGVEIPNFISITGIASKSKTFTLTDSVPFGAYYGLTIVYIIKAISDCKQSKAEEKTITVTVGPCLAPTIVFDPSGTTLNKAPGEKINLNIVVTDDLNIIESIVVSKSLNGITNPAFISITGIGTKGKTVIIDDSVPKSVGYGSVITYVVTASSVCNAIQSKTLTVTVGPSSAVLDDSIYLVGNLQGPRVYNRFSVFPFNNTSWDLQNRTGKFAADPNSDKDIRDSVLVANPFSGNTRWGSRNGSKFVKAPASFDFTNASSKSIFDAYNAGIPSDLVGYNNGDFIIVNIRNTNRLAVVKIKNIVDDGAGANEDYTYFAYKLAQ